jgi:NAD(P)-dependent dehydrogenase (short-subunit alcohol dehydrogenase family)
MMQLHQKIAIVTGAGSGIGRALAHELAARGARVVAADLDGKAAIATASSIGPDARGEKLDVTDGGAVRALIEEVVAREGRIDLLFNSAGVGMGAQTDLLTDGDWARVLDVNLRGVIHGVQAAYPIFKRQGFGHIVNTASVAGLSPYPFALPYTTSKHAVVGLSHALRAEAAGFGVRVSVACPGRIDTAIWTRSEVRGWDRESAMALLAKLPRGVSAERCAKQILDGVAKNRATIVVTNEARVMWLIQRISPSLGIGVHRTLAWAVRRFAGGGR